jgi:SRSO17 transposase
MEAEMDLRGSEAIELRFGAYVEGLTSVIGHADRARPLRDYCLGLMMPCERKSVLALNATRSHSMVIRARAGS